MRSLHIVLAFAVVLATTCTATAQEPRASVQAFGGLGVGSVATVDTTFGGVVTARLTPNVQVLGEAGRIGNVLPTSTQSLVGLSPIGFGVSAWYGGGGVRFTGGSSGVRPYVETSAGIARLRPQISGLQSGIPAVIADLSLRLLERTAPLATVGGGVTLEGGPLVVDFGYRHRRIFSESWIEALALGGNLNSNEVRVGVGVRF